MDRFFGMMPSNEIDVEKYYQDESGSRITIQAGLHGWTVIYADSSSQYNDIDATTEANFELAYSVALNSLGVLREVNKNICYES